jgi:hypothetical protein
MDEQRGFFSIRRNQMNQAERAQLDAALADRSTFRSTEKDGILAWLILGAACSVTGLIAGLAMTDWPEFFAFVGSGDWSGFDNYPEGLGAIAALLVTAWIVWFFFRVHNRWGFVVLPHAVGVVRGARATLIRIEDVAEASSSWHSSDTGSRGRSFSVLKIKGLDGSRKTFYSADILYAPLKDKLKVPEK